MRMDLSSKISYGLTLCIPVLVAIGVYWTICKSVTENKRTYGKRHGISHSFFTDYGFSRLLLNEICVLAVFIISFCNTEKLMNYASRAWALLLPLGGIPLALIAIVYSYKSDKYLFFSPIELIESKGTGSYARGILIFLFSNIVISVVVRLQWLSNNRSIFLFINAINITVAGLCVLCSAYVSWSVCDSLFGNERQEQLFLRLWQVFDMPSIDNACEMQYKLDSDTRIKITNILYVLIDKYLNYYQKMNGDCVIECKQIESLDRLSESQKKSWRCRIVIKLSLLYAIIPGIMVLSFINGSKVWLACYSITSVIILIILAGWGFRSETAQKALSGIFGYDYIIQTKRRKREIVFGYDEPFCFNIRCRNYLRVRNSLIACCLLLIRTCNNEELLRNTLSDGIDMVLERQDDKDFYNTSFIMIPFVIIDRIFYDSEKKHLFDVNKYNWLIDTDKSYNTYINWEKMVLARNYENPLSIRRKTECREIVDI